MCHRDTEGTEFIRREEDVKPQMNADARGWFGAEGSAEGNENPEIPEAQSDRMQQGIGYRE